MQLKVVLLLSLITNFASVLAYIKCENSKQCDLNSCCLDGQCSEGYGQCLCDKLDCSSNEECFYDQNCTDLPCPPPVCVPKDNHI